jgi:hypothetical protein
MARSASLTRGSAEPRADFTAISEQFLPAKDRDQDDT